MIIFPIMTFMYIAAIAYSEFRPRDPDSYDLWLQEPTDLEVIK